MPKCVSTTLDRARHDRVRNVIEINGRKDSPAGAGPGWGAFQGGVYSCLAAGERFEGFAKKRAALSGRPCSPCRRAFTRLSVGCRSTLGHRRHREYQRIATLRLLTADAVAEAAFDPKGEKAQDYQD
jgi:hypothetical protein